MRISIAFPFAVVPALALLVAGCGGAGQTAPKLVTQLPAPLAKPALRPALVKAPPKAALRAPPGLEGVIGVGAADLARQFGTPRLEVWEGDARKLQFSGIACVLDVFLYPAAESSEPLSSYAEARRASDGREVDRASCIAALRKR